MAGSGERHSDGPAADGKGGFGALLRQHRLRANLTHATLAARSDLSVDSISMLERGVHLTARRSTLLALATALRLPAATRDAFFAAAQRPAGVRPRVATRPAPSTWPPAIAEDWKEAHAALAVGLPRAAAAMALRAIQGVCVEHGAAEGESLSQRIGQLAGTNGFHPALVEWAQHIPLLTGADVRSVTNTDAAVVVVFLDELLSSTYEVPERLGKLIARSAAAAGVI